VAADETDEQLMRRFQRGEARAFETLMLRHRTPVHAFLLRLTGERTRAEDLTQETFLRLVQGAASWEPRAAVRTWLFTIARNLATDLSRRQVLRATESLEAPAPGSDRPRLAEPASPGPAPDEAAEAARLRPRLEAALAALAPEQREVFLLREHAGLGFAEIAEALQVNENTVKSRMRYALLALRERLASEGIVATSTSTGSRPS
jgi:RNA polymerase sigma-70 factor (ECF subfamily)